MYRRKTKSPSLIVSAVKVVSIIIFGALIGYTAGRFIESATVQHVYSVSTPVSYLHPRLKNESDKDYQSTIAADQATIGRLVNVFKNDSAMIKEFKAFSKKYNTSLDYSIFKSNIEIGQRSGKREIIFIGKSSDPVVAANISKSYAEDSVVTMQKISDSASINVELSAQKTIEDTSFDHKFGMIFLFIGLAIGLGLGVEYWFSDNQRRTYFYGLIDQLNGK